jgi:hypothetical protein
VQAAAIDPSTAATAARIRCLFFVRVMNSP